MAKSLRHGAMAGTWTFFADANDLHTAFIPGVPTSAFIGAGTTRDRLSIQPRRTIPG